MKDVKRRFHLALREYHLNPANAAAIKKEQEEKMGILSGESSDEAEEVEEDQDNGEKAVKDFQGGGAKLFMEGIGYSRIDIQGMVQKLFGTYVSDNIEMVVDTNEDIL